MEEDYQIRNVREKYYKLLFKEVKSDCIISRLKNIFIEKDYWKTLRIDIVDNEHFIIQLVKSEKYTIVLFKFVGFILQENLELPFIEIKIDNENFLDKVEKKVYKTLEKEIGLYILSGIIEYTL